VRIAVVTDIHANLAALEAVLAHAGTYDAVWCLGDSVGYGPQPAECVARLRELGATWVAGNHERAATGAISTEDFNSAAGAAALWTGEHLGDADKAWLDALPETEILEDADFTLVHGTLRWPIWEYMFDEEAAVGHLSLQRTKFGFVGHTHVPAIVTEHEPGRCTLRRLADSETVDLAGDSRLVLKPGSVGQPRDSDRRASYGTLDTGAVTFTLHRVEYDVAVTQRLMSAANLPAWLIERLDIGR